MGMVVGAAIAFSVLQAEIQSLMMISCHMFGFQRKNTQEQSASLNKSGEYPMERAYGHMRPLKDNPYFPNGVTSGSVHLNYAILSGA